MSDGIPVAGDISVADQRTLIRLIEEQRKRERYSGFRQWFPEEGPLSWRNYPRHTRLMNESKNYRERLFMAGNRTGKTVCGAVEVAYHATGQYPDWWKGHRFNHPVQIWAAGDNSKTTRNIIQYELLGHIDDLGTGAIPKDCIIMDSVRKMPGVQEAIEIVQVKHAAGGNSIIEFKAYEQGRKTFQGTAKHFIWFDEEPPADVYNEALMRTMVSKDSPTGGLILTTCTPLSGWTQFLLNFDKEASRPIYTGELGEVVLPTNQTGRNALVVQASMVHAPHLDQKAIEAVLSGYLPSERKAREEGIPSKGSGAIYPVPEEEFVIDPIPIPTSWKKAYALDVGWNTTAAIFGAYDPQRDTIYFYDEYYRGKSEAAVHAQAIRDRYPKYGPLPGVIDPASRQSNQVDGRKLMDIYRRLGLRLIPSENAVDAGLTEVWGRLASGKIKVFSHMVNFLEEYKMYRRDESGKIIKENDHLMDCMRYWILSGIKVAKPDPMPAYERVQGSRNYGV